MTEKEAEYEWYLMNDGQKEPGLLRLLRAVQIGSSAPYMNALFPYGHEKMPELMLSHKLVLT